MKVILLHLFLISSVAVSGQTLTGHWKGTITTESNGNIESSVQQLEMNLIQTGTQLDGCSHDYTLGRQDYCRASLNATYDKETGVVKTYGKSFIEKRSSNGVDHILFDTRLVYRKMGDKEMLVGKMINDADGISGFFFAAAEKIVLYKVGALPNPKDKCYFEHIDGPLPTPAAAKSTKSKNQISPKSNTASTVQNNSRTVPVNKEKNVPKNNLSGSIKPDHTSITPKNNPRTVVPKPAEPQPPKKAADTTRLITIPTEKSIQPSKTDNTIAEQSAKRDRAVLSVIKVKVPVIKIELYDNGEIDGDTVSVIHNGEVIVSNKMLTDKPITVYVNVKEGDRLHEITMFAHNLGRIAPNTALMIVTAGEQRFELRTSQDLSKNAVVVFEYIPD